MKSDLKKVESRYWRISKIISVVVVLFQYLRWTEPFNIIKALLMIIGISVVTFCGINILDSFVKIIIEIAKYIKNFKLK
jgi:hypothetical protein